MTLQSEQQMLLQTYTVHNAVERIGFGKFQIVLSFVAGFAWMAESMEIMLLSILSPSLVCEWGITPFQQAMGVTCVFVGWMISSPFWGWFFDTYGRRTGLFLSTLFGCLLGVATSLTPSFPAFIVVRGCVGLALGGVPQSATIYTEFLPTHARARCIILLEVFFAVGAAVESMLALVIVPRWGWRVLVACSSIPLGISALCCGWLPESPRYYISHGKVDKALEILTRVAKMNGKELPEGELVSEHSKHSSKSSLFTLFSKELRRTTAFVWSIWMLNAFLYYGIALLTTKMFQSTDTCHGGDPNHNVTTPSVNSTGVPPCVPLTTSDYIDILTTSFSELPGLLLTVLVIDRVGRKNTMLIQFLSYSISASLLLMCMERGRIVALLFIARAMISGSFQTAYVYTPEVYPTTLRALGLGTSSMFARIGSMITPMVAQVLADFNIVYAIVVYAAGGILGAVASKLLPIETAGRELRDTH